MDRGHTVWKSRQKFYFKKWSWFGKFSNNVLTEEEMFYWLKVWPPKYAEYYNFAFFE